MTALVEPTDISTLTRASHPEYLVRPGHQSGGHRAGVGCGCRAEGR